MRTEEAATFGLQALGWLAGNDTLFPVFMGSTGAGIDDVRARAQDPEFLGSVLDFLLMDDQWVLEFSSFVNVQPEIVLTARRSLPGGEQVEWT